MHARTESPQLKRRLAFNRGRLAPPPAMDYRPAKPTTECVNQFQRFFLSELILHYTHANDLEILLASPTGNAVLLMAGAGGTNKISNATLTFNDAASTLL